MGGRVSKESWDRVFMCSRELWNKFDPIGVIHLVDDEYDTYAGEAALLATRFAAKEEFLASAKDAVYQKMALRMPIVLVESFGVLLHRELSEVVREISNDDELYDE